MKLILNIQLKVEYYFSSVYMTNIKIFQNQFTFNGSDMRN